jgi:hypothetical protein
MDNALLERAQALAEYARDYGCGSAMIGGAPYLMHALNWALIKLGIVPLYAFSAREAVETVEANGAVRKVMVFRHKGFVVSAAWIAMKENEDETTETSGS